MIAGGIFAARTFLKNSPSTTLSIAEFQKLSEDVSPKLRAFDRILNLDEENGSFYALTQIVSSQELSEAITSAQEFSSTINSKALIIPEQEPKKEDIIGRLKETQDQLSVDLKALSKLSKRYRILYDAAIGVNLKPLQDYTKKQSDDAIAGELSRFVDASSNLKTLRDKTEQKNCDKAKPNSIDCTNLYEDVSKVNRYFSDSKAFYLLFPEIKEYQASNQDSSYMHLFHLNKILKGIKL